MGGHVFQWRGYRATALYLAQPMFGMLPLAALAMLGVGGGLVVWLAQTIGVLGALAAVVGVSVWSCLMTGRLVLVWPGGVWVVAVYWGVPWRFQRLALHCTVEVFLEFDFESVILSSGCREAEIETSFNGSGALHSELQRALHRAAVVPVASGPRIIGG